MKELSTDDIINRKKSAIRKLNNLLEGYIKNPDPDIQKKAFLISNWLSQFVSMNSFEKQFDPCQNISYKRGDVVKVNLGFNIGCELGGPHYGIVVDKNNKHSADTLTIIPLVSVKPNKEIYERDVFLGSELYNTLTAKYNTACAEVKKRQDSASALHSLSISLFEAFSELDSDSENQEQVIALKNLINTAEAELESCKEDTQRLQALANEISLMKEGSIARIEQITTISKMRIWIPKKTTDVLYGISYSTNSMQKINDKLKELFIFDE